MRIFFGTYFGALGETSTLLIILVGIILSIRNDINWRTPVFYIGTVCLTSLFVGLCLGINNPLEYMIVHLSLGGLVFGGVFMLTDPVTGPTSNFGKVIASIFAGFITVVIRYSMNSSYPEGVIFAIALSNIVSPVIDYYTVGKSSSKLVLKYIITCSLVIFTMVVGLVIANNNKKNNDISLNESSLVFNVNEEIIPFYIKEVR